MRLYPARKSSGTTARSFLRALRASCTGAAILVAAWLTTTSAVSAETVVSGALPGGEWTEAASPYHATADLQLAAGLTLSVQPGVEVRFDPGVSLVIQGVLNVNGTEEKPVRFVRADAETRWGGVAFRGSSSVGVLEHLELSGAWKAAGETRIAFKIDRARVTLRKCWFHDFQEVAIDASGGGDLLIQDCLVENSMEAIHTDRTHAIIEGTTIRHVHDYADSIDLDYVTTPPSVIRNCLIEDNSDDDGIDLQGSNAIVEDTIIRGVAAGKAISIDLDEAPTIRRVLVYDCYWGFVVKDKARPIFSNCTVTRCDTGFRVFEKTAGAGGGHMTADSMIVWGNTTDIFVDAKSTLNLTYSLAGGGWAGTGNVDADPLFANAADDDFRLLPGSPAIGTGKAGVNMGARPPVDDVVPVTFIRGDSNGDGTMDIGDAVTILLYLFSGGVTPSCLDALDADDALSIEISDAIYVLSFLFLGDPPPPPPFPDPGIDPTAADTLSCAG